MSYSADEKSLMKIISGFCARRERSEKEVLDKLESLEIDRGTALALLKTLQEEGFQDERRFAAQFVEFSFHQKKWGKLKIKEVLQWKQVKDDIIVKALEKIDPVEYSEMVHRIIDKNRHKKNLYLYLLNKGFEEEVISEILSIKGFNNNNENLP